MHSYGHHHAIVGQPTSIALQMFKMAGNTTKCPWT